MLLTDDLGAIVSHRTVDPLEEIRGILEDELRAKVPQRIQEPSGQTVVEHPVDPFEKVREIMQDELRAKVPQRISEPDKFDHED